MGYFISKATFSGAVIHLICYPFFHPHVSHTHQTKVCLGWETGGKEAGGDTEGAELGWGLARAPLEAKSNPHRSSGTREETGPSMPPQRSGKPVFLPVPTLHLCCRRQGRALRAAGKCARAGKTAQSLVKASSPTSIMRLGAQAEQCSLDGSTKTAEQPSPSQTWWDSENMTLKSA